MSRHLPLLLGLFTILLAVSSTMIVFRLIGLPRTAAFYFACLVVATLLHLVSRRVLRKG